MSGNGRESRFVGLLEPFMRLAGELGFEPRQTESESVVLPLHHSPKLLSSLKSLRHVPAIAGKETLLDPPAERPSTRQGPALASKTRGLQKVADIATRPEGLVIPLRRTRDRFGAGFREVGAIGA